MPKAERIPFEEAISEPLLLRKRMSELSLPQQVVLKLLYGVELSERKQDAQGFSELDYWTIFHDGASFDELGYPTQLRIDVRLPRYEPREYREGWFILGRRAGKTDAISSTIVAYEALCGGHEAYLRPGQHGICFQVAQDLRLARNSLHFIRAVVESSPLLARELVRATADRLDLRNRFSIASVPATLKSVRGFASPCAVFDEVGVWYQESESANPDYEIYRALTPGQIQFPFAKLVGISSPWNKAGMLYQYWQAGTEGYKAIVREEADQYQRSLVIKGPTAMMGNPQIQRSYLAKERARDERAFDREFLANFQDSISGFLPTALVEMARDHEINERAPAAGVSYVAAIDPAFKHDAFTLGIFHVEGELVVQDVVRRFIATAGESLSPRAVLDALEPLLRTYRLSLLYSDQFSFQALQELFRQRNFEIVQVAFTSKSKAQLYGNVQQLLLQRKLRLLDHPETIKELKSLERTLTEAGGVQISAPRGQHDDCATVVALGVSQALWFGAGELASPQPTKHAEHHVDYHQLIQAQIDRKWAEREAATTWD